MDSSKNLPAKRYLTRILCPNVRLLISSVVFLGIWGQSTIAQTNFAAPTNVLVRDLDELTKSSVGDIDNDGDQDIVLVAGGMMSNVYWIENDGIFNQRSSKRWVGPLGTPCCGYFYRSIFLKIELVDIDNDQDLDIVIGKGNYNTNDWPPWTAKHYEITWFENLDGLGSFSSPKVLAEGDDIEYLGALTTGDLNGDGSADIIYSRGGEYTVFTKNSANPFKLSKQNQNNDYFAYFPNLGEDGIFGDPEVIIPDLVALHLQLADIDSDADLDIICFYYQNDATKLGWLENNGNGTFGDFTELMDIGTFSASTNGIALADIDSDNDIDIVFAAEGTVSWLENIDGGIDFTQRQIVSTTMEKSWDIKCVDIDGDADIDIVATSYQRSKIVWFENVDRQGTFSGEKGISYTAAIKPISITAIDADNDNDLDILSCSFEDQELSWFENTDGQGQFGQQTYVSLARNFNATTIAAGDIDNDNAIDLLFPLTKNFWTPILAWSRNIDDMANYGAPRQVSPPINRLASKHSVFLSDIDGDSDLDALIASDLDSRIAWYENIDGQGTFDNETIVHLNPGVDYVQSLIVTDLNGDNDMDILCAFGESNRIVWFENRFGDGNFSNAKVISYEVNYPVDAIAADIDNDSDLDIFSASSGDNTIAWFRKSDSASTYSNRIVISESAIDVSDIHCADINNDTYIDLIAAMNGNNTVAWYENVAGSGDFIEHIISTSATSANALHSADLDNDNDIDIIASISGENKVVWFENIDGSGNYGPPISLGANQPDVQSLVVGDFDSDGDIDVISSGENRVIWYRNRYFATYLADEDSQKPRSFSLAQNYPNPFNPTTEIRYTLPAAEQVEISVYNMLGQKVNTLLAQRQEAGIHHVRWNGRNEKGNLVSSGIYIYRMTTGRFTAARKMILLH